MKITSIKQQVHRKDRYAISIDGKYAFSFGELELLNTGLRIGQELSVEEVSQLKDAAQLEKLYDRALSYIALRPRSRWELEQYFKRKKFPTPLTETILNKLSVNGYLDDVKFAQAWVNNRRLLKPISRRRLIQELRAKRVASEIIDQVIAQDETDEQEVLRNLVIKKRLLTKYKDDLKLMQYLSRQGYDYSDIKKAVNDEG